MLGEAASRCSEMTGHGTSALIWTCASSPWLQPDRRGRAARLQRNVSRDGGPLHAQTLMPAWCAGTGSRPWSDASHGTIAWSRRRLTTRSKCGTMHVAAMWTPGYHVPWDQAASVQAQALPMQSRCNCVV